MSKKKILVVAPVLSQSGYGEQSRFALRALRSREDLFDIYIHPIPWGKTGWIWESNEFREWMDERIVKTSVLLSQKQLLADISLQITIPNEWKKIAPVNIGYTAGIETSKVAPVWLQKGNEEIDKILVVSQHAKETYKNTVAMATNSQTGQQIQYRLGTPIEVVHEMTERADPEPFDIDLDYDFNFLTLSQWSPRKNFENTITWWVEEFIDQEVGLVVKTSLMSNSIIDRQHTNEKLKALLSKYPNRKCKVYLLHGDLTSGQMTSLYNNEKVKALVNIAHGEGFGLPMFEAAREALPIVTVGWSGHLDFLSYNGNNMFQEVEYVLQPVQQESVWPGVIEADSLWTYADQGSYKMALRDTYKNYTKVKNRAKELQALLLENFNEEILYKGFCEAVHEDDEVSDQEIEDLFASLAED